MFYLRFFIKKKNSEKLANRSFLLISSFLVSDVSESLISLKSNEQCKRIAQVAHQKWVTMTDSLRLLRENERSWANRSGCSPKSLICSFLDKIPAIRSEIKWANSQPWCYENSKAVHHLSYYIHIVNPPFK